MSLCSSSFLLQHEAGAEGFTSIVSMLLAAGANPDVRGMDNSTPLHDAASHGHLEVVKVSWLSGGRRIFIDSFGDSLIFFSFFYPHAAAAQRGRQHRHGRQGRSLAD